jgi:hypothetical protein
VARGYPGRKDTVSFFRSCVCVCVCVCVEKAKTPSLSAMMDHQVFLPGVATEARTTANEAFSSTAKSLATGAGGEDARALQSADAALVLARDQLSKEAEQQMQVETQARERAQVLCLCVCMCDIHMMCVCVCV